jgi:tetratricopeptide (TPR) repeat protein
VAARTCRITLFTALGLALAAPGTTLGQSIAVIGGGYAQECYEAVKRGMGSRMVSETCTRALSGESLSRADRAATHVNRGIIALRARDSAVAMADFDAALRIAPGLGAAYLNRSAASLLTGAWLTAETDASTALSLGVEEPWAAHFNRAVARERQGDVRGAWEDFTRASTLAPEEAAPKAELARFEVRSGR